MLKSQIQLKNSIRYLSGFIFLVIVVIACAAFAFTGDENFDKAREEIMLRKVGHELLLSSGDSTSRVLPVSKINANEYQIRFENEFSFKSDSLVNIVKRALESDHLADNYMVRVLDCSRNEVVFGYAIAQKKENSVLACTGREQPKGCYLVNLTFQRPVISTPQKTLLIAGLPLLAFAGLMVMRPWRPGKIKAAHPGLSDEVFSIGKTVFNPGKKQIQVSGIATDLTPKENKLLLIFAASPNTIIERGRLQKEIWEDEGVIVGRSLDVFISKLRKKLEPDPSIQIVNVHGKGYKLEITEPAMA